MTVLPFLAIAFGAAAASLLTRHYPKVSAGFGIGGLAVAALAAARISATDSLTIGGGMIAGSEYLRLFAILGCLVSLALAMLGMAVGSHRNAPGVLLAGMGAAVLALSLTDARIAVLAATAGAVTAASPSVSASRAQSSAFIAERSTSSERRAARRSSK